MELFDKLRDKVGFIRGSPLVRKIMEATSNEPWGASSTLKEEIAKEKPYGEWVKEQRTTLTTDGADGAYLPAPEEPAEGEVEGHDRSQSRPVAPLNLTNAQIRLDSLLRQLPIVRRIPSDRWRFLPFLHVDLVQIDRWRFHPCGCQH